MDRRATLATLLGRSTATMAPPVVNTTLDPYTGPFAYEQAAHLLRRATFGATYAEIKTAADQGLAQTITQLFVDNGLPDPPVNYNEENDPNVPIGETWINAPYPTDAIANLLAYRNRSLRAWQMGLMLDEGISIREQLTLFWHNHFAVANINDAKFVYRHINLLRSNAWGNFRELVKEVTIDPAMLRFLNGNQNINGAPNENYARELLELYTIGKGEQAGPGDYTTFTEDDVREMARVLTGWRDIGFVSPVDNIDVNAIFINPRHDTGTKQLSNRFDNVVITNMGDQEYAHLIDIIFEQDEVARFICRKLYRWFVYYEIDDNVEVNIIEPMAQILIDNDYEIRPALEALLSSEHFFDILNMGPMIKNPMDFIFSVVRQFEVAFPQGLFARYNTLFRFFQATALLQMEYFNPPSVAGWKAYYQEPQFYRTWINATTLQFRFGYTDVLALSGFQFGGQRIVIDPLAFVASIDNPYDPNALIEEFVKILFPQPITDSQKTALKTILLPGLPDFEWTVEYGQYVDDPENSELAQSIETKLRLLLRSMLSMPEFYLS
jgi:uncharacterized protein (DUF1800 family)